MQAEVRRLLEESFLLRVVGGRGTVELSEPLEIADAFYLYRMLLGRCPSDDEFSHILWIAPKTTLRDFILGILASPEFHNGNCFIPSNCELQSEMNGFVFRFRTSDFEMGVRMGLGSFEPNVGAVIERLAPTARGFVDCGANTGYFTCKFLHHSDPQARAWAFEPEADNFVLLQKNVDLNRWSSRCSLHNAACGETRGSMEMSRVSKMLVGVSEGSCIRERVEVVRVDEVIDDDVDIVKIDVEGAEPAVLTGLDRILRRSHPVLIVELNEFWLQRVSGKCAREVVSLIESYGYVVSDIEAVVGGEIRPVQIQDGDLSRSSDVVCVPVDDRGRAIRRV